MAPLLLLALAMPAAAERLEDWLVRMDHAMSSMSYRGSLISLRSGRIDTLRVVHRAGEDGIRERIYTLDGPERELLRNRDRVRFVFSDRESLVVDKPFPSRLLPRIPIEAILGEESMYRVAAGGQERVAGRTARRIEILPRDEFRYGRSLSLDVETGMLLRSVLLDQSGRAVEMLSFVDIEIDASIDDEALRSALREPAGEVNYRDVEPGAGTVPTAGAPNWLPATLPPGFRLSSVGHTRDEQGRLVEHLLFSDGLACVSIWIEPAAGPPSLPIVESLGAVHVVLGQSEDLRVTVVGEVPPETVRLIGQRMRRAAAVDAREPLSEPSP